jgi:hypothetical protein
MNTTNPRPITVVQPGITAMGVGVTLLFPMFPSEAITEPTISISRSCMVQIDYNLIHYQFSNTRFLKNAYLGFPHVPERWGERDRELRLEMCTVADPNHRGMGENRR